MSAKPSTLPPLPWITVTGCCGVHRPASRAQLALTTLGTTTSSGNASAACAASSAWAVLPSPGSSASRNVRWPSAAAATTWAWWCISIGPAGRVREVGSGSGMQDETPPHSKDWSSGPISSQPASRRAVGPGARGGEVGDEERVGELARDDRLRHDRPFDHRAPRPRRRPRSAASGTSMPAGLEHLGLELQRGVGDVRRPRRAGEQRGVAGGGLGEDRADAVEPLELLGALALGDLGVGLDPDPLLAGEQGDDLELRARRGSYGAALGPLLDLAHRAGEHGDDALVVEVADAALAAVGTAPAVGRAGGAGLTLSSSSQRLFLLGDAAARAPGRYGTRRRAAARTRWDVPRRRAVGRPQTAADRDGLRPRHRALAGVVLAGAARTRASGALR